MEDITGFYLCIISDSLSKSIWSTILGFVMFIAEFLIPFSIFAYNYARIGKTLFHSLKENVHLQEGIKIEWVKIINVTNVCNT